MLGSPMRQVLFLLIAAAFVAFFPREAFAKESEIGAPLRIEVPGAPDAFYYKPRVKSKAVIMYLHGRGGNPAEDCRKWARVGTQFGWVVCPQGSGTNENGGRTWANGPLDAKRIIDATLDALKEKYKSKIQRRGNVLVGFSEGAWVAMNVGLADQRTWNRWLILGASEAYWGDVTEALDKDKRKVRRVYLLTGEEDGVAQSTLKVGETLKKLRVPVKVKLIPGMGHKVPADKMVSTYRRPLAWLTAED
jgi:predicted esterase